MKKVVKCRMMFRGRTVIVFVLLAVISSSLVTLTVIDPAIVVDLKKRGAASFQSKGFTQDELNKINAAYRLIESRFYTEVDRDKVADGAINGMIAALNDPYSVYMDKTTAKQFSENLEGSFSGIGAEVTLENGKVTVVAPIKGSPAEKAGIHAKDILLSVNGEELDGLDIHEAVAKIKGPKGTKAKLKVQRPGMSKPIEFVLVRDDIKLETVRGEMLQDHVGKIEIAQFSQNTAERFHEELERLERDGMKGLIIDVRNDPGGILPIVISMAEPFLSSGKPIVQVEGRDGKADATVSKNPNGPKPYPVAVLINKGSASASEILAAALQESGSAKLIGETTFGKGTVQMSYDREMGDGSLLKMTVAKWLTPNGNWIHEQGIEPDLKVEQPDYYWVAPLSKEHPLKFDMNDDDVKNAQLMLKGIGYSPGRQDGYYSNDTVEAVKQFQQSRELPVTGTIDRTTAEKLEEAIIGQIRQPGNDKQLAAAVEYIRGAIRKP